MTNKLNMKEMEAEMRVVFDNFFGEVMDKTREVAKGTLLVGILRVLKTVFAEARVSKHMETGFDQVIVKSKDGEIHSCVLDIDPDDSKSAKEWVKTILLIFNRVYSTEYALD